MLVVFAGLPGTGKSVLSRRVADALDATYLRIDTIEATIVASGFPFHGNPVGYRVAMRVAADQLRAGRDVVADAVNGADEARTGWGSLADEFRTTLRFVEVVCSDVDEHQRRVESRAPEMPGHGVPTWDQVRNRRIAPWRQARLVVDNLGDPAVEAEAIVLALRGA